MSDGEGLTRKLPGGQKIVDKVDELVEKSEEVEEHVAKKRKVDEIPAKEKTTAPPLPLSAVDLQLQEIDDLESTLGDDWREALKLEFEKGYFRAIKNFLKAETRGKRVFYPATKDIYSWSRLTPLKDVKVIIVGQDPYHGVNQAHGLSFSVLPPTKPPPSLINIYKEMANCIEGFVPPKKNGDLSLLAEQGVLWLNTALTVRASTAASHSKIGWDKFTRAVMEAVVNRPDNKGVVFMAWGSHAQKAIANIDKKRKNKILTSAHPSPLSASKGFFGNDHFKIANQWLEEKYGEGSGIDWTVICKPGA